MNRYRVIAAVIELSATEDLAQSTRMANASRTIVLPPQTWLLRRRQMFNSITGAPHRCTFVTAVDAFR